MSRLQSRLLGLCIATATVGAVLTNYFVSVEAPPLAKEREVVRDAVARWATEVLAEGNGNLPVRELITEEELAAIPGGDRYAPLIDWSVDCFGFSRAELAMIAAAGPAALPILVEYVGDERVTPYVYWPPHTFRFDRDPWMVGEVAAFMIEVILRDQIYFTPDGLRGDCYVETDDWITCGGQEDSRLPEPTDCRRRVLRLMAKRYQDWFRRCYDRDSFGIICSEDDLPDVPWTYHTKGSSNRSSE